MKMYKNITLALIAFISLMGLGLTGCSAFLDKEYDASLSEDKVFGNATQTRQFLSNIYTNLPDGIGIYSDPQFVGASRDCMTDNATSYWGLHFYNKINTDTYTAKDHPLLGFWRHNFSGIRKCNQFIINAREEVIGNDEVAGDDYRLYDRYIAEAKFLRAIFHFELVAYFGDAPILEDVVLDMDNQDEMNMERENAAEVLQWIADQCDEIKDVLPFRYASQNANWGRINGAAAYALKARALLYKASALNNSENNTNWWTAAANAAKSFMDKNQSSGSTPFALFNDYQGCFYESPFINNELILTRSVWNTTVVETSLLPEGFTGCSGRTNPTQNFVDCFEMNNGLPISDPNSGYDPSNPYAGRDPRFEATIFRHGSVWGRADYGEERAIDVHFNSADDMGADYRGSLGGTYTGYYLKKFVNPTMVMQAKQNMPHVWTIYRYAEILLNYAEAQNEAVGPDASVYSAINEIRARAGMPDLPAGLNKDQMRQRIRNERRVELSFEDHRFFDLRRWKAYEGVSYANEKANFNGFYNNSLLLIGGVQVALNGSNPDFNFTEVTEQGVRVFNTPKNYLFPIPFNEVAKAPKLGQNPGWE
nr:RagB/SusD family nutrient uptake outer membrane protein [uncultured Carboxylicivirga sp.]